MPKKLEQALLREAERRGYSEERKNRYVYGTLRKIEEAQEEHKESKEDDQRDR
jgi:hypothetical protein